MDKRSRIAIIGMISVILIIVIALGVAITKKLTPSDEVMLLTDYYEVEDKEVLIILQDEIYEKKGMLLDGVVYLDYETVIEKFNHRFYWDYNENILTYTTPDEIIRVEAGSSNYTVTKSMIETNGVSDYPIVKVFADKVYLALDFVKQYSDLTFQFFKEPSRVVINYKWGEFLFTEVSKNTQLRKEPNIKSPILTQLSVGTSLMYIDLEEAPRKGFSKVITEEGIIGYVKDKTVKKSSYKNLESTYQPPVYTSQTRPGKINMVFHQVFNENSANSLEELIKQTKNVTVVSPTWFSVTDSSGNISSLATKDYIEKANILGLEVWALVNDFNTEVSMLEVLSHTKSRDNLSNSLIDAALEYKLNGINIDFEGITSDSGPHYVQFLRELSVKCRNNGIVLSVDNYVPKTGRDYYDMPEQGAIVDYIVIMAYDEHYEGSEPGPVASIGFVKDAISNLQELVPKEKTIIAIPFYNRLWKETEDGNVTTDNMAMTPAADLIKENGAEPKWDETLGCYYAEYEKDGATYRLWQEDDKSIDVKMKAIYEANVAGVAAWKLGLEKASVWDVILRYLN